MRNTFKIRFAGIGIILATCAVFGVAVMLLWNALMPQIFGLMQIDYLQAAGLLILARILFGGIGGGLGHVGQWGARGYGHSFHHSNKLREKWMNMSKEEREEFLEKEKEFFKFNKRFSHFRDFYGDEESAQTASNADAKKGEGNE